MNFTKNNSAGRSHDSNTFKKIAFLFLCAFLFNQTHAQTITENQTGPIHPFYLGVGTGFDNFTGLIGLSGTIRLYDKLAVRGGIGLSGWGYKNSIGLKYDLNKEGRWSYCLGYSYSSGLEDLKLDMELETGSEKEVTLDYLSCRTINLAFDRNWRIGKANLFYLELGYAIPLQSDRWRVTDGSALSGTSKSILNSLQPGGLIVGAGFAFKIFD